MQWNGIGGSLALRRAAVVGILMLAACAPAEIDVRHAAREATLGVRADGCGPRVGRAWVVNIPAVLSEQASRGALTETATVGQCTR